ncbi:MAG TPA: alkaline phosphatase family protein [Acetobacteraceae bacterium]|nr:alkaline phosphatase family protein [Acetobacteraceae bacterium]
MSLNTRWKKRTALLAATAMMHAPMAWAASTPQLTGPEKLALLQQKVKYVFVLYQENRSFDHYFGTFPGANGLFSKPASATPGFNQLIVDTDGTTKTISPFLIPQTVTTASGTRVPLYPADIDSVDHSHAGIDNSLNVDANNVAHNDRYALNAEGLTTSSAGAIISKSTGQAPASAPTLAQKQKAELTISHVDCDTVPFLWNYARQFALFDNFHQTEIGPSTPNAIALIAGQSGETQWARHPGTASVITGDQGPYAGSKRDTAAVRPPYGRDANPAKPAANQTYASLPLTLLGNTIKSVVTADQDPAGDLSDVADDITAISETSHGAVNWRWYQEGYDHEPADTGGTASHSGYIVHHEGPQYFGYIADNTKEQANLRGLNDFFTDISAASLPSAGGVFYVRGGYQNIRGLKPADPNKTVQANFLGDDDHPGYSDAQISEALVAREVNAIADSPYWSQSVIIITYDETDGLYDHGALRIRSRDANGAPLAGGPRIPALVISPYAASGKIVHDYSEHSSVIKFINALFDVRALGSLPDEVVGRRNGLTKLGQANLIPGDVIPDIGDLLGAFDDGRLSGTTPVLPASAATIPDSVVNTLPHYNGQGCKALGITPTDYVNGQLIDPPPADFNPRPSSTPGLPTSGNWNG